jgi:hypothetical protein
MKILRFNESNTTQYITCVIVDEYNFDSAGTFKNEEDKDNWLLNRLNKQFAGEHEGDGMEMNQYGEYVFIDVGSAQEAFEFDSGCYIFTFKSNVDITKNYTHFCVINTNVNRIYSRIFKNKEDMTKWLIDFVAHQNHNSNKIKSALSAKNWLVKENDDVYYGETKFYENVKLEYGVELFRSKEEFNL